MTDLLLLDSSTASAISGAEVAAAWLCCRIDLTRVDDRPPAERSRIAARLARGIQEERLKGLGGARGYSLDRHIALKHSLDRVANCEPSAKNNSGARRRRRSCKM